MATAEELERSLASHRELRSIVRTMKALSAASIHQYEHAASALDDYFRTVELGMGAVLRRIGPPPAVRASRGAGGVTVVFGTDHGLCGRINADVATRAAEHLRLTQGAVRILAVGARLEPLLAEQGHPPHALLPAPVSAARIKSLVSRLLLTVDAWAGTAGAVSLTVVYAHHRPGGAYRVVRRNLFPLDPPRMRAAAGPWPSRSLPAFSMEPRRLLGALLREYLFVSLFRACAESQASEHGSRLGAMRAAERNLDQRIDEVTLACRRVRQGAITAELLDVVAGYEATGGEA